MVARKARKVTAEELIEWIDKYMADGYLTINGVPLAAARYVLIRAMEIINESAKKS